MDPSGIGRKDRSVGFDAGGIGMGRIAAIMVIEYIVLNAGFAHELLRLARRLWGEMFPGRWAMNDETAV